MEKTVLVLFGKGDQHAEIPFNNSEYQVAYELLYTMCEEQGIRMCRASYEWYDDQENVFTSAWVFDTKNQAWRMVQNITPDLIYDKTATGAEAHARKLVIAQTYPFLNDLNFTKLIDDKFLTSLIFSKWSKKCWYISSQSELESILPSIETKKIVVKPVGDSGGRGVFIVDKNDLSNVEFTQETIVQEFIDSSQGIPGICESTHDLRLVFVGEKLIYAYTREPQTGSFLANVSLGGTLTIVSVEDVPQSLEPVLAFVHAAFDAFPDRVFTVDFMFDEHGKPWIVECNSMPGLFYTASEKPFMIDFYKELIQVFKRRSNVKE